MGFTLRLILGFFLLVLICGSKGSLHNRFSRDTNEQTSLSQDVNITEKNILDLEFGNKLNHNKKLDELKPKTEIKENVNKTKLDISKLENIKKNLTTSVKLNKSEPYPKLKPDSYEKKKDIEIEENNSDSIESIDKNVQIKKDNNDNIIKVDTLKKNDKNREDNSRSIDVDKYVSPEFHNINNVYTLPISADTEKYIDHEFEAPKPSTSTTPSINIDIGAELTTPKAEDFDKKYIQRVKSVDQKLDNVFHDLDNPKEDTSVDLINHTKDNDTKTSFEYTKTKHVEGNNNKNKSSIHKVLTKEEGTKIEFKSSYNKTDLINDQNDKLNKINNNSQELIIDAISEESKELRKGETTEQENNTEKNIVVTTQKNVSPTKTPLSDKSHIISNKIETDKIKAYDSQINSLPSTLLPTITERVKGEILVSTTTKYYTAITKRGNIKFTDYTSTTPIAPTKKISRQQSLDPIVQQNQVIPIQVSAPDHLNDLNDTLSTETYTTTTSSINKYTTPQVLLLNATDKNTYVFLKQNKSSEFTTLPAETTTDCTTITSKITEILTTENELTTITENDLKTIAPTTEIITTEENISTTMQNAFSKTSTNKENNGETTISLQVTTEETTLNDEESTVSLKENTETTTIKDNFITESDIKTSKVVELPKTTKVSLTTDIPKTTKLSSTSDVPKTIKVSSYTDKPKPITTEIPKTTTENAILTTEYTIDTKDNVTDNIINKLTAPGSENDPNNLINKIVTTEKIQLINSNENITNNVINDVGSTEKMHIENRFNEHVKKLQPNVSTTSTTTTTKIFVEPTALLPKIVTSNTLNHTTTMLPEIVTSNTLNHSTTNPSITSNLPIDERVASITAKSTKQDTTTEIVFVHIENVDNHTTLLPEIINPGYNYPTPDIVDDTNKKNVTVPEDESTTQHPTEDGLVESSGGKGTVAAIVISTVGAVCLIILAGLLYIMRKRQRRFNYGQRCTPVSLDDYSMDNYSSVRRKTHIRQSKRSYGNPAFEDPAVASHPLNFQALAKFSLNNEDIRAEFEDIPQITATTSELPEGCETKNRYANVIPLPETRVFLNPIDGYPNSDYINANYVTGPTNTKGYYIACQGPMQNTVDDFWRMIWEQQSKVILMLTQLFENGIEKCVDYLPPSEVLDCHRLFGDFQVTLKKREVKDKYIISSLQLKNMVSNSWREVTHFWYLGWPEKGVPKEANSIIAFLIEARSFMKTSSLDRREVPNVISNGATKIDVNPVVVHCSPGTGRTGVVIACDIVIREFEKTRLVDIPKIVYKIRRDRASSVQTKEQYDFIYKVVSLYATKLTGGALDSM